MAAYADGQQTESSLCSDGWKHAIRGRKMTSLQLKELPADLSFSGLFAPNMAYKYFAHAAEHPFRPASNKFQMVNAWWLAEASMLAYALEQNFVRTHLEQAGFSRTEFFENDCTQSFVASNDVFAMVCFRGTEVSESQDIITDLKFWQTQAAGGGRVHAGFEAALDKVWDNISAHLEDIRGQSGGKARVWFTGHSLGAALATLAADRYQGAQGLYTYGSPRVGGAAFRNDFHVNAYRFVHNNDIVTMVPPPVEYQHVGQLKYIDSNGHIHDSPDMWRRLKEQIAGHFGHLENVLESWSNGAFDAIPSDYLNDHAPIYYVTRIWNNYVRDSI